jgi:hypothetical protein
MKLYARMLKAQCPLDRAAVEMMIPVLQNEIVPHAARGSGFREIYFFADHGEKEAGDVFSITVYDSEEDLHDAMSEAKSDYRFSTLARLGCSAVEARAFEIIAGAVNTAAPPAEFTTG